MAKKTLETREIVYAAFFVGVTVVLGFFIIPVYPVPVTGQSMGPMLAGSVLGGKMGALSMIVFDLLVAAGAPILSGGRGGLGILLGPTGGYIVSCPWRLYLGKIVEKSKERGLEYISGQILSAVL